MCKQQMSVSMCYLDVNLEKQNRFLYGWISSCKGSQVISGLGVVPCCCSWKMGNTQFKR